MIRIDPHYKFVDPANNNETSLMTFNFKNLKWINKFQYQIMKEK